MRRKDIPLTPEVQRALFRALGDLHAQSRTNLQLSELLADYIAKLDAKAAGIQAVAEVVDENENTAIAERVVAAQKELISFTYRESHTYITLVVAGGYAAYFTTFAITANRLPDGELFLSALLMTISLTVFLVWEIFSMTYMGWLVVRNRLGEIREMPRWYKIAWPVALSLSVLTALPAAGLSGASYLKAIWPQSSQPNLAPSEGPSTSDPRNRR